MRTIKNVTAPIAFFAIGLILLSMPALSVDAPAGIVKGPSGLPLPRFVSLKADRVNVRNGPGTDHGIKWIYRRLGLPVEITQEYNHWRQIRDSEGAEGWIFYRLLSRRRTAVITPWQKQRPNSTSITTTTGSTPKTPIPIYGRASNNGDIIAQVESGVIVHVAQCDGTWCKVSFNNYRGWIEQVKLWGVYPDEKFN